MPGYSFLPKYPENIFRGIQTKWTYHASYLYVLNVHCLHYMSFVFDICEKLSYFEMDTKLATFKIPDPMHITYPLKLFAAHYHLFATSRI